jgi:hypothetical protein
MKFKVLYFTECDMPYSAFYEVHTSIRLIHYLKINIESYNKQWICAVIR